MFTPRKVLIMGAVVLMQGCVTTVPVARCSIGPDDVISQIDTQKMVAALVTPLCPVQSTDLKNINDAVDALVVPDFVNVHSLQPHRTGVYLGEIFRAHAFNICKSPVRQVELSKNFRLNPNGLMALTRNAAEVRQPDFQASTALIGTYDINGNKLTLIGRRLDIGSANLSAVSTQQVVWTCEEEFGGSRRLVFNYQ